MRSLLEKQNVLNVIDEEMPNEPIDRWLKHERTAKNLIVQNLYDSLLGFAKDVITAKDIIKKLDSIYERMSLASQLSVRKKLLNLKLKADESLNHFTIFDELVTELHSAGGKLDDMDKVSHLLLTMPTVYDGVITALETLAESNLTLAFVKTRLLDQEIKIKSECKDTSAKVLNTVVIRNQKFKDNKDQKNKNKFKLYKNNKNNKKCHHCGRLGHLKMDCFYYKRQQQQHANEKTVNVAMTQPNTGFAFILSRNVKKNDL